MVLPLTATSIKISSSDKSLSRTISATTATPATDGHEASEGGDPLLLPAGGAFELTIVFTPASEGTITLQQVSIALCREP